MSEETSSSGKTMRWLMLALVAVVAGVVAGEMIMRARHGSAPAGKDVAEAEDPAMREQRTGEDFDDGPVIATIVAPAAQRRMAREKRLTPGEMEYRQQFGPKLSPDQAEGILQEQVKGFREKIAQRNDDDLDQTPSAEDIERYQREGVVAW